MEHGLPVNRSPHAHIRRISGRRRREERELFSRTRRTAPSPGHSNLLGIRRQEAAPRCSLGDPPPRPDYSTPPPPLLSGTDAG